jgi:hypothetical protein
MSGRFWAMFRRVDDDERGMVLANVIIFGTVLMTIVAGLLVLSTSGAIKTTADRNYQNAMAAAYAGLADYQSKISNNNSYEQYGSSTSQFTKSSGSNVVANSNPAFTSFVAVPSTTDEFFRYEVDNSAFQSQGILKVRVTGMSGNVTRSLVANLKGDGFIDYLYFTNYESADPTITGSKCTVGYQWAGTNCPAVQFGSGDVLNGPVRTNDDFTSCGGTFNGAVEDNDGIVLPKTKTQGCAASTFNGGSPTTVPYLGLPALNTNMAQEARTDVPASVPSPGCLYTGPTKVLFNGDGTMTVWSPWTRATQITVSSTGVIAASSANSVSAQGECGSISALQSSAGATIPTLPTNLMYVQDVPQTNAPSNANYWGSSFPTGYTNTYCNTTVTRSGSTATTKASTTYSNGVGFPAANEWINNSGASTQGVASSTYNCTSGDVFVSGAFAGAMTIAASGTVWVTGNITYVDPTKNLLGLVGQDSVEVYNPTTCTYSVAVLGTTYCTGSINLVQSAGSNRTIDAAIASNAGTFWVQNYDTGRALGTLAVVGSIAQNWRGTVAVSSNSTIVSGYTKNYQYDSRLLTTAPPKFLQPVATSYGITTQVEVQPAYNANGSCATDTTGACR